MDRARTPARAHIFDAESGARIDAPPAKPEATAMAERTTHDHADVVIVGSGPGGVIPAMVLARKGIKVVCLEQGSWFPPDERPHHGRDWEWRRATDWSIAVNVRAQPHDYPVDSTDETTLMWNGVGGSTGIYTATWPRYRPSDFRKGTEHGLAPDWPISYEDLAPYFEMADEACGVSGWAGRSGDAAARPLPDPTRPARRHGRGRWRAASTSWAGTGGPCPAPSWRRATTAASPATTAAPARAAARAARSTTWP